MKRFLVPLALAIASMPILPSPVSANPGPRTLMIPHILETTGRITNTPNTFDTTIFATYAGGLDGPGEEITVHVHLFNDDGGGVASSQGFPVCGPCTLALDGARPLAVLSLENEFARLGGIPPQGVQGYAVVEVSGPPAHEALVAVQAVIAASSATGSPSQFVTNAFAIPEPPQVDNSPMATLARTLFPPPPPDTRRTFMVPHMLERSRVAGQSGPTAETTLHLTRLDFPLGGAATGGPVRAEVSLYQPDGVPVRSATGAVVCAPCTFDLYGPRTKHAIAVADLLNTAGGPPSAVVPGFMVVTLTGDAVDNVNVVGFVVNSKSSALDLSVFGFEPKELRSAAN